MRKFLPLPADHPLITDGEKCPACNIQFVAGDVVTLIPLGPGDDPEVRRRVQEGRAYNAIALPIHWACATGEES